MKFNFFEKKVENHEDDTLSKVTKVILNDLQGKKRVVHHDFANSKIITEDIFKKINKKKEVKSRKNKDWEFMLLAFTGVLLVSMFVGGLFIFGGDKNKEDTVSYKDENMYKPVRYEPTPKKQYPIAKTEYRKKPKPT